MNKSDRRRLRRARNARLTGLRRAITNIRDLLESQEDVAGNLPLDHITDAAFWADLRDDVNDVVQCAHEANAYNNSLGGN